jgi:hypothetical protein
VEYDGIKLHHQMMEFGAQNLQWDKKLDHYARFLAPGGKWETFEKYFAHQNANDHASHHRTTIGEEWRACRSEAVGCAGLARVSSRQVAAPRRQEGHRDDNQEGAAGAADLVAGLEEQLEQTCR